MEPGAPRAVGRPAFREPPLRRYWFWQREASYVRLKEAIFARRQSNLASSPDVRRVLRQQMRHEARLAVEAARKIQREASL